MVDLQTDRGVGDRLRAEPFEAVEMALDEVFDLGEA